MVHWAASGYHVLMGGLSPKSIKVISEIWSGMQWEGREGDRTQESHWAAAGYF